MKATILGKPLCVDCQNAAAILRDKGYDVTELDINTDPDAMALHALIDGGETIPVVTLRGVPKDGL